MKFKQKQDWSNGNMVRVGFLTLTVVEKVATVGDYKPDFYILQSPKKLYQFTPHHGLVSCDGMTLEQIRNNW